MKHRSMKISKKYRVREAYEDTLFSLAVGLKLCLLCLFVAVCVIAFVAGHTLLLVGLLAPAELGDPYSLMKCAMGMAIAEDICIATYILYSLGLRVRFVYRTLHVPLTREEFDALSINDVVDYMVVLRDLLTAKIPFVGRRYYDLPRKVHAAIQSSVKEHFDWTLSYDDAYVESQPVAIMSEGSDGHYVVYVTHKFADDEARSIADLRKEFHFSGGERKALRE